MKLFPTIRVPVEYDLLGSRELLLCTCLSFRYPHSPEAHRHLGRDGDLDWRTWEERQNDHWEEWG